MGMYTELHIGLNIDHNAEGVEDVIEKLQTLVNDGRLEDPSIYVGASFYFPCPAMSALEISNHYGNPEGVYIRGETYAIRFGMTTNIKNYYNQIANFLDWIEPWVEKTNEKLFVGTIRYEEDAKPTLIYVKDGKFTYKGPKNGVQQ